MNPVRACLLIELLLVASSQQGSAWAEDELTAGIKLKPAAEKKTEQTPIVGLDKIGKRVQAEHKTVDIFKGKSWYVAPPKPKPVPTPPPPPPPPPTAPPMPYVFMGNYQSKDGRMIIFLSRGDQVYSVSPGDVLEGTYRVEGITSGQLVMIYLPLNITQKISIGEAS